MAMGVPKSLDGLVHGTSQSKMDDFGVPPWIGNHYLGYYPLKKTTLIWKTTIVSRSENDLLSWWIVS